MKFRMCVVLLALAAPACQAGPVSRGAISTKAALIPLEIHSAKTTHILKVEVARTEEEQSRGLMFRTHIPADGGMLFPFSSPREASFWMKNCPVPEDMIFIRSDGSIARIAANTTPYSLDPVNSGEPVSAVLEIAGGRAAELGIVEGDHVIWDDKPS